MIQKNQESLAKLSNDVSNNWFQKALKHRISFLRLRMIESMDLTVAQFNAIDDDDHLPGDQNERNDADERVDNNARAGEAIHASGGMSETSDEDDMVIANLVRQRNWKNDKHEDSRPNRRRRL